VTLIVAMSKPEGIYMAVDYRVTDSRTGRLVDDASIKYLTVHYPPSNGPRALVAYTGLAVLPDGTPTGTWIRETLRGETESPDRSMAHLRLRLNRDFARLRYPLIVNVLALHDRKRYFGGLSNMRRDPAGRGRVQGQFGYLMKELKEPSLVANGSGAVVAASDGRFQRMQSLLDVVPRRPQDFMNLLALTNRSIAASEPSVSPFCHVSFINSTDYGFGSESRSYVQGGESVPFVMPLLLEGVDLTGMLQRFLKNAEAWEQGQPETPLDVDEINREIARRP
jgi:hypothetical protein